MCEQTIWCDRFQRRFQAQCQFIESEKRGRYNKKDCDYPTQNFHALSVAALFECRKRCEASGATPLENELQPGIRGRWRRCLVKRRACE